MASGPVPHTYFFPFPTDKSIVNIFVLRTSACSGLIALARCTRRAQTPSLRGWSSALRCANSFFILRLISWIGRLKWSACLVGSTTMPVRLSNPCECTMICPSLTADLVCRITLPQQRIHVFAFFRQMGRMCGWSCGLFERNSPSVNFINVEFFTIFSASG